MEQFASGVGKPIYNLQEFLRVIAQANGTFPTLIPDGIYGEQTERIVLAFQKEHGLNQTGEVDNDTWDKIIEEYSKAVIYVGEPPRTSLFPSSSHVIKIGDSADFHYPIQSIIYAIAQLFDNIDSFEISNKHEGDVVETTKQLQNALERNCGGEIDVKCWRELSRIYENLVSKDTFGLSKATENMRRQKNNSAPNKMQPFENYVDRNEITSDIRRERELMQMPENERIGIITPRLDAYNIRREINDESSLAPQNNAQISNQNQMQRSTQDQMNNDTDMENRYVQDNTSSTNNFPVNTFRNSQNITTDNTSRNTQNFTPNNASRNTQNDTTDNAPRNTQNFTPNNTSQNTPNNTVQNERNGQQNSNATTQKKPPLRWDFR